MMQRLYRSRQTGGGILPAMITFLLWQRTRMHAINNPNGKVYKFTL